MKIIIDKELLERELLGFRLNLQSGVPFLQEGAKDSIKIIEWILYKSTPFRDEVKPLIEEAWDEGGMAESNGASYLKEKYISETIKQIDS